MVFYTPTHKTQLIKIAKELLPIISPLPWYVETYNGMPGRHTVIEHAVCRDVLSIGKWKDGIVSPLKMADGELCHFLPDLNIKEEDLRYIVCACNLLPRLLK